MVKKLSIIALFLLFASVGIIAADTQTPPPSPWGPGVKVEPVSPAPSEPVPQPPPTQPTPPATAERPVPAPTQPLPQATPEQPGPASANRKKAMELVGQGNIAMFSKKKFDEANKLCGEAEKLDPTLPQAPFCVGMAYRFMNKPNEAIAAYERAKKLKPDEGNIYLQLGDAYSEIGNSAKAIENYNEAVKLIKKDTDRDKARDGLIIIYTEQGKWADALAVLDEAIKANPMIARKYVQRGDVYAKMGKFDEAMADYKKALELLPGEGGASVGIARVQILTGKASDALKTMEPVLKKYPNDPAVHLVNGKALLASGKSKEGLAEVEAAIAQGLKSLNILLEAAQVLIEAKQNDRAVEVLTQAAQLAPKSPKPHEILANLYDQMGKKDEAAAEKAKAKELGGQ